MKKIPIEQSLQIDHTALHAYSTGLLQGKAYRSLNSALAKVVYIDDLSIPEWKLLGQLVDHGLMRLADLAERLDVEPPLVTKLIDQLEKKEMLRRTSHSEDKRAKVISITKKGKDTVLDLEPKVKVAMGKLLYGTTPEELRVYLSILQRIVNNAGL